MAKFAVRSTAPDAYIAFFPYEVEQTELGSVYNDSIMKTSGPEFVRTDLLSVSTTKSKGGAGTWSCTLAPNKNYKSIVQPGCWCMIFMADHNLAGTENPTLNNDLSKGLKMLGIVRSVRADESIDPNSGTRTLRYMISGDDFHTVLDAQAYINPALRIPGDKDSTAILDAIIYFKESNKKPLTPKDMVTLLTTTLLGKKRDLASALNSPGGQNGGIYGVPPEVARRVIGTPADKNLFIDLLKLELDDNLIGDVRFQPQLASMFTLWSMLESYSNKVVNEIYTELLPIRLNGVIRLIPSLVLRPIPFTSAKFKPVHSGKTFNIPVLKIKDAVGKKSDDHNHFYTSRFIGEDQIFSINYGKTDSERFNFFFVASDFANELGLSEQALSALIKGDAKTGSQNSLGDADSVARHGLRPYLSHSNYGNLTTDAIVSMNLVVRDLWHEAYLYENGQAQIVGTSEYIPVGTNVQFIDRDWIAHVESVSNSYVVEPNGQKHFRTNIAFVRLQTTDGTPIDFAKGAKKKKGYQQNITGVKIRKTKKGDKS